MMSTRYMTPEEIRQVGLDALTRALGPVGALRFLRQFDTGRGDYTAQRHEWQDGLGVAEVAARIRGREPEWEGRGLLHGPQDNPADQQPEGPADQ